MNLYGNRPGASFSEKATTNKILSVSGLKTAGQINSAIAFANEVKKEYGEAAISTTGHSLGGFLALYVAAEKQWKNVGFNGPDPYDLLSPEAKNGWKKIPVCSPITEITPILSVILVVMAQVLKFGSVWKQHT